MIYIIRFLNLLLIHIGYISLEILIPNNLFLIGLISKWQNRLCHNFNFVEVLMVENLISL